MLNSALDLAAQGWAVLPCREAGSTAKAPYLRHGFHEASRDPGVIRAWWERWPHAMIGAPVPETLLVLDVDPRNGGSRTELEDVLGPLPHTLTVTSGRGDGGQHLYFLRPVGQVVSARLPAGIDLKVSGYCIVPPSLHPATGRPYVWNDALPVALPARALAALRPAPRPRPRPSRPGSADRFAGLVRAVGSASVGGRNAALFWAACRAVDEDAPEQVFDDLAAAALSAGLTEREAHRTIDSARRRKELAS
ncbi:bifunctional DNA primase/polymerase [Xylanimonas allomyrinae]|uniref:bifunctional DNA primase/polymerase n=1 Tax=Xylanimonas allomyrinae TaxID=2509459 RepID=UPI0013A65409|nr:bifunctional DNA primase/polymerase [Xylanimonas allomyrinae]